MAAKFRVAICGGGIGGMCLAVALSKYPDIDVTVYEAASSLREVGAGVMLWGRTWRVISLLGLDKAFRTLAGVPTDGSQDPPFSWTYRRSDGGDKGHHIHTLSLPSCPTHKYHRAHVLELLASMLPPHIVHLSKRVVSYQTNVGSRPVTIAFADGSTTNCDLLVGCDGIKSVVRRTMYEGLAKGGRPEMRKYIDPVWTGETVYRALIPAEQVPKLRDGRKHPVLGEPIMYCGKNKHFMGYPIARGRWANLGAFFTTPNAEGTRYHEPWVQESTSAELLSLFSDWESEIKDVLKVVDKPAKWAIHQLLPLPRYTVGPVVLLGDAAHAMQTHHAAGAGQAFEDAYVLAGILGHPSIGRRNISLALRAYEHIRLPIASEVMSKSAKTGPMFEFRSPECGDDYTSWIATMRQQFDWVERNDPFEQLEAAMRWMRQEEAARVVEHRL